MASASFDDSNWNGWFEVDSDETKVDEATGDLMVDLGTHAPSEFWSNAASDGGDVRITNSDGSTAYSFELENFDTGAQTGILFFDSQAISTSSSVTFRIYAGNGSASMPAETDTLGAQNVWGSNYKLVNHLEDTNDSTANNNDASANGGVTVGGASGPFGNSATLFDGNDDYLGVPDDNSLDLTGNFTFLVWFETTHGDYAVFWDKGWTNGYIFRKQNDLDGDVIDTWFSGGGHQANTSIADGNWHLGIATYDQSNLETYLDGSLDATHTESGSISTNSTELRIGGDTAGNDQWWEGRLAEARIYEGSVTSNWQQTHYNNQSDNASFWTAGSWETTGGEVTYRKKAIMIQ